MGADSCRFALWHTSTLVVYVLAVFEKNVDLLLKSGSKLQRIFQSTKFFFTFFTF